MVRKRLLFIVPESKPYISQMKAAMGIVLGHLAISWHEKLETQSGSPFSGVDHTYGHRPAFFSPFQLEMLAIPYRKCRSHKCGFFTYRDGQISDHLLKNGFIYKIHPSSVYSVVVLNKCTQLGNHQFVNVSFPNCGKVHIT